MSEGNARCRRAPVAPAPAPAPRPRPSCRSSGRAAELAALVRPRTPPRAPDGRARRDRGRGRDRQDAARARADRRRSAGLVLSRAATRTRRAALRTDRRAARRGRARIGTLAARPRAAAGRRRRARAGARDAAFRRRWRAGRRRRRGCSSVAAVLGVATLVFVDDVHAADEATLDVSLTRRGGCAAGRCCCCSRGAATACRPVTGCAGSSGSACLTLGRLDERRCRARRSRAVAPELAQRVYAESEGLPLFVAEYLAALAEGGEPGREMRDLVAGARRGARRDRAAAARDRGGDRPLVQLRGRAVASGRGDEEATDGLDELVGRGLVRELAAAGRLRLHPRQAARARLRADRPRAAPAAAPAGGRGIAAHRRRRPRPRRHHLRLAGDDAGAAEQHRIAAEHAASVLAFGDALDHLDAALGARRRRAARANGRPAHARRPVRGRARKLRGGRRRVRARRLARLEHKLGGVHQRRGEWDRAQARYTVALEASGDAACGRGS